MTSARAIALAAVLAPLSLLTLGADGVAAAEFRAGDRLTVAADETVGEDLYIAGGTSVIAGTVQGDLLVAGGVVDVTGSVTGSVNVVGGNLAIGGTVGGAVRVAGGNVTISGQVGRDVVAAGGNVTITQAASVAADVAGGVGALSIAGTVEGDVLAAAGDLIISGNVGGNIDSQVGQLRIDAGATVGGDVRYTSEREAQIADGAQIGGTVERSTPAITGARSLIGDNPVTVFLGSLLGLLLLGWGLMLVRPTAVAGPGAALRRRPVASLVAGLAMWIAQFLVLVILVALAALVGQLAPSLGAAFLAPFALVLLAIIAAVLLAQVWVSMAIGTLLAGRWRSLSAWLAYAVGAAVWVLLLTVLGYIAGALGGIVFLAGWILGLGAVTVYLIETRRREPYETTYAAQPPHAAPPTA